MNEENRFITIETKLAHQEFLLEELNQVVYRQQLQIDQLEKKIASVIKRVENALVTGDEIGPAGEKPPHY
jgi:SlyX protein